MTRENGVVSAAREGPHALLVELARVVVAERLEEGGEGVGGEEAEQHEGEGQQGGEAPWVGHLRGAEGGGAAGGELCEPWEKHSGANSCPAPRRSAHHGSAACISGACVFEMCEACL